MTDPVEQIRLARAYLDGGDPLQAVEGDSAIEVLLARTLERRSEIDQAIGRPRIVTAMSDRAEYRERLDALEARRDGQATATTEEDRR